MPKEIDYLVAGYKRFHEDYYSSDNNIFEDLVKHGQKPRYLVVACSDSRVDPAIVLNCKPGDLFVVRNVANLIPPYEKDSSYHGTSAALEFGVLGLDIRHIIVFGHTFCGGIMSLLKDNEAVQQSDFISQWMKLAEPARDLTLEQHPHANLEHQTAICGKHALKNSIGNLLSFPWIKERVETKQLFLHAWQFDLVNGTIKIYNQDENKFNKLL